MSNNLSYPVASAANNGTNHHMPPPPPFELDFDKFDMLSEFPDLDHYNNTSGMIHHGASGPLLSSAMANSQQAASNQGPQPQSAAVHAAAAAAAAQGQTGQNNSAAKHSHRHNITDYSPDWAWSDVSTIAAVHSRRFILNSFQVLSIQIMYL